MCKLLRATFALAFLLALSLQGEAQSRITTYAGPELPKTGFSSNQAIDRPAAVISDGTGGLYVASLSQDRIYRIAGGSMTLVAGTSYGFSGDGGLATAAQFRSVFGIAVDSTGNLYVADTNNHRIRKITTNGLIQTVAGNGIAGYAGDGDSATAAQLQYPKGIALDSAGNLYIADEGNHRIRLVTTSGRISTVAGSGTAGSAGDGGNATAAQLNRPAGITVDRGGSLYIAEFGGHRVRRVTAGQIVTVAGNGIAGYSGDGGLGPLAQLNSPIGVAIDDANNLYIADSGNHRIRRVVTSTRIIGYVAGDGTPGFTAEGESATDAHLNSPFGVAVDSQGYLYVADTENNRIRGVFNGMIATLAGNGTQGFAGDSGLATSAQLSGPRGMVMDKDGNLYVADTGNSRIRLVTSNGTIVSVCCSITGIPLDRPYGVALDAAGTLYIADTFNHRIRRRNSDSVIVDIAGYGSAGYAGDGGVAVNAKLNQPRATVMDASGNLYIADSLNHAIRKISGDGRISTIAGYGVAGFGGDGGPATQALLNTPSGIAIDAAGNLYIADTGNRRIRKINPAGIIITVAGATVLGVPGANGDGLPATASGVVLSNPTGVAVDKDGNIFISEMGSSSVRVVTRDGVIQTAVGVGTPGFSGDGFSPTDAQLNSPEALVIDPSGNLFIADTANHRVRKVTQPVPPIQGRVFSVSNRGGVSLTTPALATAPIVGYGRYQSTDSALAGLAIFSYRQGNVLISEAAVPATRATTAGRIYARLGADGGSTLNTGLAIANPNDSPAEISFYFTGSRNISGSTTIAARSQIAAFLDQPPFNGGAAAFEGTFTFNSSVPVAATALRGLTNGRGEFLVTTLPVAELSTVATGTVFIPHFAAGGGWTTQIALINPTDSLIEGRIQFFDQAGSPVSLTANGVLDNTFSYSVPPREAFRLSTSALAESITVGSVRILPSGSSASPSGVAIFSFQQGGVTVTEAGVSATSAGSAFHMYVETAGNFGAIQNAAGSMQTGIAIANLSAGPATVSVTVDRLDGSSTGLTGTLTVPGNGQVAAFLNQIPGSAGLPSPFQGVLRLSSNTSISVVGLRGRYNERNEFLITTIPAINDASPPTNAELFFPHFADSGGYTTQFIFLSGSNVPASGSLRLVSQSGQQLELTLR